MHKFFSRPTFSLLIWAANPKISQAQTVTNAVTNVGSISDGSTALLAGGAAYMRWRKCQKVS